MVHVLDEAIAVTRTEDGVATARTHRQWENMVGPFGGITAATAASAVLSHPDVQGEVVAITVNFAAPLAPGEWSIAAEPVRTNRTSQHWTITARQGADVVVTATAVTGVDRDTWADTEAVMPEVDAPDAYAETRIPFPLKWLQNYRMRFVAGEIPIPPAPLADDANAMFWLRHAEARPWDAPALIAASDAFYPRVFRRRGPSVRASTITLTTYLHASDAELAAAGPYLLLRAGASRYGRGLFEQRGEIWSEGGALLATTYQLVYFSEPRADA